mmetsp:Transcript_1222/g.2585  ORF Transcript_1222/g.2585 Transcript_1222/m.2585 type:complete len:126 (+) Transcript_1222:539-916(+)
MRAWRENDVEDDHRSRLRECDIPVEALHCGSVSISTGRGLDRIAKSRGISYRKASLSVHVRYCRHLGNSDYEWSKTCLPFLEESSCRNCMIRRACLEGSPDDGVLWISQVVLPVSTLDMRSSGSA